MRVLYNTSKLPLLTQMAWFIFQTLLRRIALAAPGSVAWSGYETRTVGQSCLFSWRTCLSRDMPLGEIVLRLGMYLDLEDAVAPVSQ